VEEIRRSFESPEYPAAPSWSVEELSGAGCATGRCGSRRLMSAESEEAALGRRGGSVVLGDIDWYEGTDDPRDGTGSIFGSDDGLPGTDLDAGSAARGIWADIVVKGHEALEADRPKFEAPEDRYRPEIHFDPSGTGGGESDGEPTWYTTFEVPETECHFFPVDAPMVRNRVTPCSDTSLMENVNTNTVFHNCSPAWDTYLQTAWCLLSENEDIIRWVCSLIWSTTAGDLIVELLHRRDRVDIRCKAWDGRDVDHMAEAFPGSAFFDFYIDHPRSEDIQEIMECEDSEAQLCAMVWLSSVILHELVHTASLNVRDDPVGDCETSFLAQGTYLWAMLQRYQSAMSAYCCRLHYGHTPDDPDTDADDNDLRVRQDMLQEPSPLTASGCGC
jgi:hypothetical protein